MLAEELRAEVFGGVMWFESSWRTCIAKVIWQFLQFGGLFIPRGKGAQAPKPPKQRLKVTA